MLFSLWVFRKRSLNSAILIAIEEVDLWMAGGQLKLQSRIRCTSFIRTQTLWRWHSTYASPVTCTFICIPQRLPTLGELMICDYIASPNLAQRVTHAGTVSLSRSTESAFAYADYIRDIREKTCLKCVRRELLTWTINYWCGIPKRTYFFFSEVNVSEQKQEDQTGEIG